MTILIKYRYFIFFPENTDKELLLVEFLDLPYYSSDIVICYGTVCLNQNF